MNGYYMVERPDYSTRRADDVQLRLSVPEETTEFGWEYLLVFALVFRNLSKRKEDYSPGQSYRLEGFRN
jgi:hypothetical protein